MQLRQFAKTLRKKIAASEPESAFSKWLIVTGYKLGLLLTGNLKKRKANLYEVINETADEEIKSNPRYAKKIYNDIMFCRFIYGIAAREYFTFDFEKLSHKGRKTFVTRGNKYDFYRQFNNVNYTNFFNLKTETIRKFGKFYKRDVLCMYDENDFEAFEQFVQRNTKFIYKPANDYGGHGIEIYDSSQYESVRDLFDIIIYNGFCVVEELIVQAHEIAQFHPQSVNTMRVVAFLTPQGNTEIQWCFLRMGMGGNHTDNMSSGGLAALVDPETGIIYTSGRDWLGYTHIAHPDTGVQLVGFQIPEWDNLLKMVDELAHVLPEVRLVGWDLAYTDKGWVFVEGNARPQCVSVQITEHNGKLHLYQNMAKKFELAAEGEEK